MIVKELRTAWPEDLIAYLVGPGHHNEHHDPTLIAADAGTQHHWGIDTPLTPAMATDLNQAITGHLDDLDQLPTYISKRTSKDDIATRKRQPWRASHIVLSAAPTDGQLDNSTWRMIVNHLFEKAGIIDDAGHSEYKWAAINHGASQGNGLSHIHVVIASTSLAGRRLPTRNDMYQRLQAAALDTEKTFGLYVITSREKHTATRGYTHRDYAHTLHSRPVRDELKRRLVAAAYASKSETEYFARLRSLGVDFIPRWKKGTSLTRGDLALAGYAVKLAEQPDGPWYAAGKISKTLTLPNLRHDHAWSTEAADLMEAAIEITRRKSAQIGPDHLHTHTPQPTSTLTDEWNSVREHMRGLTHDDPAWVDITRQYASSLYALSTQLEKDKPGKLYDAADALYKTTEYTRTHGRGRPFEVNAWQRATGFLIASKGHDSHEFETKRMTRLMRAATHTMWAEQVVPDQKKKLSAALRSLNDVHAHYKAQAQARKNLEGTQTQINRDQEPTMRDLLAPEMRKGIVLIGDIRAPEYAHAYNIHLYHGVNPTIVRAADPAVIDWVRANHGIGATGHPVLLYDGQFQYHRTTLSGIREVVRKAKRDGYWSQDNIDRYYYNTNTTPPSNSRPVTPDNDDTHTWDTYQPDHTTTHDHGYGYGPGM
ncbi:hypothetical protein H8R18_00700 [Nanchangia anserum]|uniref:MobA/VirD2-like nuclease domain-containing protein n=1 Tax=Nanchangia anserum TaxID=2692125 RepID=A0A8I0GDY0_9ACTO|nr:hypothetical protein [Nanchangia anserum]MBD3689763.1 hypothetical protein [Nanchangia anserum]QOX81934.1 hypothetical protein H8R18_00700 [Nanchangia anserum]